MTNTLAIIIFYYFSFYTFSNHTVARSHNIEIDLSGNLDFRGFLDIDNSMRPGYLGVKAYVKIDSTASDEEIEKLKNIVNEHCPVLDIFSNKTPVDISVSRKSLSSNKDRQSA